MGKIKCFFNYTCNYIELHYIVNAFFLEGCESLRGFLV